MLNGINSSSDRIKSQNATEVTNTENLSDSYDCHMFSLKDIYPEDSCKAESLISPVCKVSKCPPFKFYSEEASTNFQCKRNTEEVKSSVGTSITEFRLATLNSPEVNKYIEVVMSASPCAMYCGRCKNYVLTSIDSQDAGVMNYLWKITSPFLMCCGKTDWIKQQLIHKCPNCSLTLGKY